MTCTVPGCDRPRRRRDWCATHYARWRRTGSPVGTGRTAAADRFWAKVAKGEGCWEWQGYRMPSGHGRLSIDGAMTLAHRYAWTLLIGPLADDVALCHRCDNPPCVRPDHLFTGSRVDNIADMDAKGRRRAGDHRGASNSQSKLNDETIAAIRQARANGESGRALAKRYGVSASLVSKIALGRIWRHV